MEVFRIDYNMRETRPYSLVDSSWILHTYPEYNSWYDLSGGTPLVKYNDTHLVGVGHTGHMRYSQFIFFIKFQ